jgi:hypothetical protein
MGPLSKSPFVALAPLIDIDAAGIGQFRLYS